MLTMCRSIMRPAGYSDSDREGEIVEDRGGILYEFGEKAKEEDPGIDMAGEEVTLDSDDMAGDEHVASGDSVVVDATLDSDDMEGDEQARGKEGDAGGRSGSDARTVPASRTSSATPRATRGHPARPRRR